MKWLLNKARRISGGLIALSVLSIIYSLLAVFFALLSKDILDIATGQAEGSFLVSSCILAGMLLLELVLQSVISMLTVYSNGKLSIMCRKDFFGKLLKKDFASVTAMHTGELVNTITSDFNIITTGITEVIPDLLLLTTRVIASFVAMYYLSPSFALLYIILGPVILISSRIYGKKMKKLHKKCQETDGKTKAFMQETLKNLLMIKSFKGEENASERSSLLQKDNFKYTIKRNYTTIIVNILYYIAITIGYYFALALGAYKISRGLMTFGTLTALLQLVGQIQLPFKQFASLVPRYYSMIASAERISELEGLPDEDFSQMKTFEECKKIYNELEKIEINDVTFRYDETNILENFSTEISKGEFVAISGRSGIGKSTLLKLLLGIYEPDEGKIELICNGRREILSAKQRGLFAYVPQGNMILSGTIRENIAFGRDDVSDDKIIEAAKTAEIWDYIKTLPNKLEEELGEDGAGLSEGQIQRLAIARALLYDAPILLLDEATSALDEATEFKILSNIKNMSNKMCIIVSHKNAANDFCDKKIVFNNAGEI